MLSGTLTHRSKDVELRVGVSRTTGVFSANPSEMREIKLKAAHNCSAA